MEALERTSEQPFIGSSCGQKDRRVAQDDDFELWLGGSRSSAASERPMLHRLTRAANLAGGLKRPPAPSPPVRWQPDGTWRENGLRPFVE